MTQAWGLASKTRLFQSPSRAASACLVAGIALAAVTEAIASTVLSFGRLDMPGDLHSTSDEFALLDVSYIVAKLTAYLLAPWLIGRLPGQTCLRAATAAMTLACGFAAFVSNLEVLVVLRVLQGASGAILLVSGQAILLRAFPASNQPFMQALFAMGAIVAPATLAPAMQGWLIDSFSWIWVFLAVVPIGLFAITFLSFIEFGYDIDRHITRLDWTGLTLFAVAASCITYVLNQGSRWNWFDEPFIVKLTLLGSVATALFVFQQYRQRGGDALIDFSVLRNLDFCFGFLVSFAAGFALSGSSYLIPSFSVSVLGMRATEAGLLLLPSGLMFTISLLLTALLVQKVAQSPMMTVPFGILSFMLSMWLLSGANGESGVPDMMPAILLRGFGLGLLFLSITLIALVGLRGAAITHGVALFNIGRQVGGLLGVAFLTTLIDHKTVLNLNVLSTHITSGRVAVADRLALISKILGERGVEPIAASQASVRILSREVIAQATIIAYESAFLVLALFFLVAAPALLSLKMIISKRAKTKF